MTANLPALGICGWSGSGKTTLLEALVPRLTARRLRVAVLKHDAHGLDVDRPGKDSDRLFRAGADVVVTGPAESLGRTHRAESGPLGETLARLAADHDLILVEGHKTVSLPRKVWLQKAMGDACPDAAAPVTRVLRPDEDRVEIVLQLVADWLPQLVAATPVCAGVLFGGQSRRMGQPKHLLGLPGQSWLELVAETLKPLVSEVVLLGRGEIPAPLAHCPVLPDVADKEGPLAGILAALRWRPAASWVFAACDLPRISAAAVRWLLGTRAPGVWATLPRLAAGADVEPLLAHYDPRARHLLETCAAPREITRWPQVITPAPPADIARAWQNVNTPEQAAQVR